MTRPRFYVCFLAVALLLPVALPVASSEAGFLDSLKEKAGRAKEKLRETTQKAREKWKERERRCADCGKTIHLGSRCASCQAKRAAAKARETKDKAAKKWQEMEHRCADCGKAIHVGTRCVSCQAKRAASKAGEVKDKASETWREMEHSCKGCGKPIHLGSYCGTCMKAIGMDRMREARIGERLKAAAQKTSAAMKQCYEEGRYRYGPAVMQTVRDPEVQAQVLETVGMVAMVSKRIRDERNKQTYKALLLVGKLQVPTDSGEVTLEEALRERIVQAAPGLAGTDIAEDPAKVVAYGVLGRDKSYLFGECKWIKKNGRAVSLKTALAESSPYDIESTLRAISIIENCEKLTNDGASGGDICGSLVRLHEDVSYFRNQN